jgi:hypothetical protein
MTWLPRNLLVLGFSLAAFSSLFTGRAVSQNISLDPTYGSKLLLPGFMPNPFVKQVVSGGPIQTQLGGVRAWVANAPDFKVYYTASSHPLTIRVESAVDTTLLVNLPDGTWVADDDSGGNLNPLLRFSKPQSGRYDIYIGSYNNEFGKATLIIAEERPIDLVARFSAALGPPPKAAPDVPPLPLLKP